MGLPLPSTLTPSKLGKFVSCPLAFRYSYIEHLPEPATTYQLKGTIVHRVLQLLFASGDPASRTPARALALLETAWQESVDSGELGALGLSAEQTIAFHGEAETLLDRYFELEEPTKVSTVGIELDLRVEIDGVVHRGIIDRLDRLEDGRFVIVDYKTGRSPRPDRSRSRMLGVQFYAFLCETLLGIRPSEVRLMYLGDRVVVVESPTDQSLRGLRQRSGAVWSAIERACDTGDFRPNPSPLCRSCAFQEMCPAFAQSATIAASRAS